MMIRIPTVPELQELYELLRVSNYKGVPGVIRLDGERSGPVLGITVCTHGNEPCGLAAIKSLLDHIEQGNILVQGTIFLVLNNIRGTGMYFESWARNERRAGRFVDTNMNRLPIDFRSLANDERYEIERARTLLPVWNTFDYAIDIHSTTQNAGSMLIDVDARLPVALTRGFDMEKLISNMVRVQVGAPAAYFYGTEASPARACGVECGAHEEPETFKRAIITVRAMLQNLGMVHGTPESITETYQEYFISDSVIFPNLSYELVRQFRNFEFIPAGTLLAVGNGPNIFAQADCHGLFAGRTKFTELEEIKEEVMFISLPEQKRPVC
jgi:predicted deacylase